MKKGIFVSCEREMDTELSSTNGIIKKILAQTDSLNIEEKLCCDIVNLPNTRMRYILNLYKDTLKNERDIDFFYIRRITPVDRSVLLFLKKIKNNNPACRILYELPTYPYDKEDNKITVLIDRLYRSGLKEYVNRIVTLSQDDIIFGIPTIKIVNGILCKNIPLRKPGAEHDGIHLIAVANLAFYHGYDRLIEGLYNYYKKDFTNIKVYFHLVGDGALLGKYKDMVKNYNLSEYCNFYGSLSGDKLTKVYNKCDLAVCSLGSHRKGIYLSSELKSREYLARGFPMITSTKIDILPLEYKYCKKIPEDESPVDISGIVDFHTNLLAQEEKLKMISDIRQFAENNCEMSKTMKPVIEYLLET